MITSCRGPTKVLDRFLTGLAGRPQPILLDLGPVVGTNVTFFGEEMGCKILVEDLSKDVDRHVADATLDALPAFLDTRFPQEGETIDGILCWDIFDYLDRASAERLARQLKRVLRPDGVLLASFRTAVAPAPRGASRPTYTKHVVVDRGHLQHRPYAGLRPKQPPLVNRDIQRMFEPLRITENFLLKNNLREVLFRKPSAI
ncbi:MAG: class I SAM-dependent methyltransferase [Acidobacteria bacterium]|nr:class I SAM-dependent methyltransferase [Acidobacteriota bacterium]